MTACPPVLAAALLLSALGASAQHAASDHGTAQPSPAASAASDTALAEVRKVDLQAGKITLKHGEINNLRMPPMTMVFRVPDPAMLGRVKAGDRVRFTADNINGAYTVLTLEVQP